MYICPLPSELVTITKATCLEDFDQVVGFGFHRLYKEDGSRNAIDIAATNPELLATWTLLKGATDNTKVTISPIVENPTNTPGDLRTISGGNNKPSGHESNKGLAPSTFTAMYRNVKQSIIKELKTYRNEPAGTIGIFFFNRFGQIAGNSDNSENPTQLSGFPIYNYYVKDLMMGQLEAESENATGFSLDPDWSDNFTIITPTDFKANQDL